MTKTTLNPKASRIVESKAASVEKLKDEAVSSRERSTFEKVGKNKWSSMMKASETPSLIADGLEALEESGSETVREQRQSYIGNFMVGDQGNIRQSDGRNVLIGDHETIDIPDAKELFRKYNTLQDNALPVLQRYISLRSTINDLIETTTQTISGTEITEQERQGAIDYLDYLYERLHTVQDQIDVAEYMRLNELNREAMDQEDA